MIKYEDLNITTLQELSPQAAEVINNHELYTTIINISGILLVALIIYMMYKD